MPGLFVTFEGIDGCGKTTQLALLAARLRETGREIVETAEPGGTAIGRSIRGILLNPQHHELTPRAELLLYFASRAQNVEEVIAPALRRSATVLCDRFTDSTIVYQGAGRGFDAKTILELHQIACGSLHPHLTFLLDIDLETSISRAKGRNLMANATETRMDDQALDFFQRVRKGYQEIAEQDRDRIRVVDACDSVDEVAARVWEIMKHHV